jgi:aryl-alcohol dehydrogenase-like predicted oxidoreductase
MQYSKLGRTGLNVSRVCLGTMTWGQQNTEAEGHEQMDYALDHGVNFFDTAELYSIPIRAETQGSTEEIIGSWFAKTGHRDKVILASKIAGQGIGWVRDGRPLTGKEIIPAIDRSLERLQTDYIDMYQLHWPNRPFPHLGSGNYAGMHDYSEVSGEEQTDNLLDILRALDEAVKAGKIRHVGLSDDTPWGMMKYVQLAEKYDLPRMVSTQHEFSLLKRSDDSYVAEVCMLEDISYLPWSPLAAGILSGKYKGGVNPEGSRGYTEEKLGKVSGLWRLNEDVHKAVDAYLAVAKKHGLDPCQMALKFVDKQNFVTSTIIGATTMDQLKTDIDAFDIELSDEVMADIDKVYRQYPIPF